jgi:hypothetical protein
MGAGIEVERVPRWTQAAEAAMARCFPAGDTFNYPELVDAGAVELYRVDGGRIYFMCEAAAGELVVHAIEGQEVHSVARFIINAARAKGLRAIRFTTHTKGLGRMLSRYGFEPIETTYRLAL